MTRILSIAAALIIAFSANLAAQDDISPSRKQAIDSLALEKVRDLSKYISIVGNKDTPWSEANRVIERTLELFADGALMGVSSINREDVNYYGIREYLERLMALNYDKVTISWYNIQYISDLERQPDGRYVGVIPIFQRFVTVYVERKTTQISGRIIGFWDVLLGDIRVTETKPG